MRTPSIIPNIYRNQALSATPVAVSLARAGELIGWRLVNLDTVINYMKIYDSATTPVVGTTVPIAFIPILSSGVSSADLYSIDLNNFVSRYYFNNQLWVACVSGIADSSTTAPSVALDVQLQYLQ